MRELWGGHKTKFEKVLAMSTFSFAFLQMYLYERFYSSITKGYRMEISTSFIETFWKKIRI